MDKHETEELKSCWSPSPPLTSKRLLPTIFEDRSTQNLADNDNGAADQSPDVEGSDGLGRGSNSGFKRRLANF